MCIHSTDALDTVDVFLYYDPNINGNTVILENAVRKPVLCRYNNKKKLQINQKEIAIEEYECFYSFHS